ncbi:MAG: hypothetical protein AB7Q04_13945 [Steroidobacteraceae bacterium]
MEKEYGKLSAEQLKQFVDKLPDLFAMLADIDERLSHTPAAKFDVELTRSSGRFPV